MWQTLREKAAGCPEARLTLGDHFYPWFSAWRVAVQLLNLALTLGASQRLCRNLRKRNSQEEEQEAENEEDEREVLVLWLASVFEVLWV